MKKMSSENLYRIFSNAPSDKLLGLIIENQGDLKGKSIKCEETNPNVIHRGTLSRIEVRGGEVQIWAEFPGLGEMSTRYKTDDLKISLTENSLAFEVTETLPGFGEYRSTTTIFF